MSHVSTTSRLGETGSRGFTAAGRSDREQMFRLAVRHSRRVRMLRIAIPAGLTGMLLVSEGGRGIDIASATEWPGRAPLQSLEGADEFWPRQFFCSGS